MSAVRSAVRIDRRGPLTSPTTSPATNSAPSPTGPRHRRGPGRPAGTSRWRRPYRPGRRAGRLTTHRVAKAGVRHQRRRQVAQGEEVLGQGTGHRFGHRRAGGVDGAEVPDRLRARRRPLTRRHAGPVLGTTGELVPRGEPGPRQRWRRSGRGRCACATGRMRGVVAAGVGPAGLAPEGGRGQHPLGHGEQVDQLALGAVDRRRPPDEAGTSPTRATRAASSESALRTTPAPSIMSRCRCSRVLATSGHGTETLASPARVTPTGVPVGGDRPRGAQRPGGARGMEQSAHRPGGTGPSSPSRMASARRAPNTIPSSSELEASRLAPCTPVQATSPAAHRPGSAVAPDRSVSTPPDR